MIYILNKKTYRGGLSCPVVPVHRPTVLGNPHPIGWCRICGRTHTRTECIEQFRMDLRADWSVHGPMRTRLTELAQQYRHVGELGLLCFCAPESCHAEVIKTAIENIVAKEG